MSLETGTYISDLVASNPTSTDLKSQGDDHIRLVKSAVKATFPNVSGAVTATHTQINAVTTLSASGFISMWPTPTAPTGFLLCNGLTVSRTTYAALFAVVGTIFGVGDGSTTFGLPNYTDRMPIGAGSLYAANGQGGSKDAITVSHTHTGSTGTQSADHTHTATSTFTGSALATHNHSFGGAPGGGGGGGGGDYNTSYGSTTVSAVSAGTPAGTVATSNSGVSANHTHAVSVDATGASGTNANLPPYLGIYFIIKT